MDRDREHTAANFVGSVATIRKTEGYGLKNTKQQLSVEAQRTLMESHKKFGEGQGTLEDFEAAIKAVTQGGIVQFGEIGNSRAMIFPSMIPTPQAVLLVQGSCLQNRLLRLRRIILS